MLCEKPFALTLDEVDAMIAAADRTGKVLAEAFMYRHHPQTRLVGEWVSSGRLGDVTLVHAVFSFSLVGTPGSEDNVRLKPETGGGALWDKDVPDRLPGADHRQGRAISVIGDNITDEPAWISACQGRALQPSGWRGYQLRFTATYRLPDASAR